MSARTFRLPDLGEGLTEAEVVSWLVEVGDELRVDQVVAEVETAKAVVEVPCPFEGRVAVLHAEPGQTLPVGEPLITVEPVPGEGQEPASHTAYREEERAGSGNVLIGYGTGHGGGSRRRRRALRPAGAGPDGAAANGAAANGAAADGGGVALAAAQVTASSAERAATAPLVISPIVRRIARERGVDVTTLTGTGPGGVVRRADVEAAAGASAVPAARPAATGAAGATGDAPVPSVPADGVERIPLRGVRKAVADKLSHSRREIPDVTIWVDVDATGLLEAREQINAAHPARPVSVLALLARFTLHALERFPELNSRVDTEAGEIVRSRAVHLGIAAQTDRGLVVPVLRDAHRMSALQLADALRDTTSLARAGELPPSRLTGGTFTLNNYGVFGVDGSTPIINHPEVAILGIGRIVDKPWAVDGQLAVRKVAQLSLAFDHRVCDGGVAGGFLRFVADCVENPVRALATL
ncbi:dihydrolipoamide acetyltransferase family protein [Thalassiella azotivora]